MYIAWPQQMKVGFVQCWYEFSNGSLGMKCWKAINRMTQRCLVTYTRRPLGRGQAGPQAVTLPSCRRHGGSWLTESSGQAVAAAAEDVGQPKSRHKVSILCGLYIAWWAWLMSDGENNSCYERQRYWKPGKWKVSKLNGEMRNRTNRRAGHLGERVGLFS